MTDIAHLLLLNHTSFMFSAQGHCRVLMAALEASLARMGVPTLALPAAADAVPTWLYGFAFKHVDPAELQAVQSEMRLFIFPGTSVGCSGLQRVHIVGVVSVLQGHVPREA